MEYTQVKSMEEIPRRNSQCGKWTCHRPTSKSKRSCHWKPPVTCLQHKDVFSYFGQHRPYLHAVISMHLDLQQDGDRFYNHGSVVTNPNPSSSFHHDFFLSITGSFPGLLCNLIGYCWLVGEEGGCVPRDADS
jgi:hypothetical protein